MLKIENLMNCTGCSSCTFSCPKQAITMISDKEGFIYPVIDSNKCIECHLCEKRCPILNKDNIHLSINTTSYAIKNNNEEVRLNSTSGGMFTILANYILDLNGIVIGASYDDSFTVRHIVVNNKDELYKLRGAKYSQSNLGNIFKVVKDTLSNDQYVLFSGTPCQVGGLKSYLDKEYDKLITIDLICHGVPSPLVWNKYLEYRSKQDNDTITHINLRSKVSGWSNYKYSVVFNYQNKKNYKMLNWYDPYMQSFVGNYSLRPSCSNCYFKGIERVSDFTLGDYWGVWDQLPDMDDNKGTSIVFIHTSKANIIFNDIKEYITYKEVDPNTAIQQNPSMLVSSIPNKDRESFMNDIVEYDFEYCKDKYLPEPTVVKPGLLNRIKGKIKRLI